MTKRNYGDETINYWMECDINTIFGFRNL